MCTPTSTRPDFPYRSAQAFRYGSVRRQLMQVYVQKSIRTTFPWSPSGVSGGELSQPVAPASEGIWECMGIGPASEAMGPPGLG